MNMKKVVVYTNVTCPYCKTVKEVLTKNKVEFEEKLTSEFTDEWNQISSLTGVPSVPTILYKGSHFVAGRDFSTPDHLLRIIKEFKPNNFPLDLQVLERVNTLNYNISNAFGSLDKMLREINAPKPKVDVD